MVPGLTGLLSKTMNDSQQTPLKEATSLITIAAILAAVGCYVAAAQNMPVFAPGVLWIASQALHGGPR